MTDAPVSIGGSMGCDKYRISIEVLENGFKVECPDLDAMDKKRADAKKAKMSEPYLGDCTLSYAAKNMKEVLKLVQNALEKIPDEYDTAFDQATDPNPKK